MNSASVTRTSLLPAVHFLQKKTPLQLRSSWITIISKLLYPWPRIRQSHGHQIGTNIVYQLRQIRSKFDADNAYSLCRASGPFTKSHVCQPFTIFTLADYDRGTSPLSSLFRHIATIVLRLGVRATLAKAIVESCLVQGNLDTQNAFTAIIAFTIQNNEIPILGNSELSKRLEVVASSLAPSLVATNGYIAKEIALAFQFYG